MAHRAVTTVSVLLTAFPIIAHSPCSSAVESSVCLWVLIVHDDSQTVGEHLFLNVYTNLPPAHPFVHPSADRYLFWDGFYFLLVNTFRRKILLNIGDAWVSAAPITQQCL